MEQDQEKKMNILVRGTLENGSLSHDIKNIVLQAKLVQDLYGGSCVARKLTKALAMELDRILKAPTSLDTSDIASQITFSVDRDIELVGLGFLGPYEKHMASYVVSVHCMELSSLTAINQTMKTLARMKRTVEDVKKQETFLVGFDSPVKIQANKYVKIEYMMKGPAAALCDKVKWEYKCDDVTFSFSNSSRQIPLILYKVL